MIAKLNQQTSIAQDELTRAVRRTDRTRRGKVISFDTATWTALVRLDGADTAATLPVGDWVNITTLGVGVRVAVIMFNDLNPNDGIVIGAYSAVGGWDYFQRESVPTGQSLTVPANHQLAVVGPFTVPGSLKLTGRLIVQT